MTSAAASPTRVRHKILALTVLVYFITYLDRVLISNAMPTIQKEFGFSIETAGNWCWAVTPPPILCFRFPAAGSATSSGRASRWPAWWCGGRLFTFFTGFSTSVTMLMICLFLIGMGEAGAFPISNRGLSRWMLPGERGIAQGAPPMPARAWPAR